MEAKLPDNVYDVSRQQKQVRYKKENTGYIQNKTIPLIEGGVKPSNYEIRNTIYDEINSDIFFSKNK